MEGVGQRNVHPIKMLVPSIYWISYLPVNMFLHTSVHPFCAERIRHQHVHVRNADRARGETEVAEGAGEQIEVFVLFFLCRKDLEHGSGGGGGEDCGGRTAVKVVEDGRE